MSAFAYDYLHLFTLLPVLLRFVSCNSCIVYEAVVTSYHLFIVHLLHVAACFKIVNMCKTEP